MGGAEEDETAEEDRQDDGAAECRRLASGTALGASVAQAAADDQRTLSMAARGGEQAWNATKCQVEMFFITCAV